jgi:asparagine synthase (glutamine-hydrolysing)
VCGICGIAALDRADVDARSLRAMMASLRHRGPDSDGSLVSGPVALGMRRLSIIDLAGGEQPIGNETGSVQVVQNGEIMNYRELRRLLQRRGHVLSTDSDTEVLVHLYEDEGPAFVERLRGMFALALWDAGERRLLLARDRFGIKPLLYRQEPGRLLFASEMRALPDGEVDLRALEAYLTFNSIPAPLTISTGTRKLPAGHLLEVRWPRRGRASIELRRYARVSPAPRTHQRRQPAAELAAELRDRLRDSVRAHLVADVPVGVLLSGGVDSSAIAAFAAMEGGGPVETFSVGFDEPSFDELSHARLVARRYGTDHHEIVLDAAAAQTMAELAGAFDEPFGDSSALPTYLVCRLARRHVKVALSGEGADELFGGYHTYVADAIAPWLAPLAPLAGPIVDRLPSSSRRVPFDYKAKRFVHGAALPPLERHHAWKEIFSPAMRRRLLVHGGGGDPLAVLRGRYAETEDADPLARLQDVDLGVYLVDDLLVKTDRASMANSLEARVPYLDTAVSDLALALPPALRVRGLSKKRLLRRAVEPLLPREVVHGPKRGFSIPLAAWLRGGLEPFARDVLSAETLRRQGYLRPEPVAALLDAHVAGRVDNSRQIWGLMAFTLWRDGRARTALAA